MKDLVMGWPFLRYQMGGTDILATSSSVAAQM